MRTNYIICLCDAKCLTFFSYFPAHAHTSDLYNSIVSQAKSQEEGLRKIAEYMIPELRKMVEQYKLAEVSRNGGEKKCFATCTSAGKTTTLSTIILKTLLLKTTTTTTTTTIISIMWTWQCLLNPNRFFLIFQFCFHWFHFYIQPPQTQGGPPRIKHPTRGFQQEFHRQRGAHVSFPWSACCRHGRIYGNCLKAGCQQFQKFAGIGSCHWR